jgi:hypothetical protein
MDHLGVGLEVGPELVRVAGIEEIDRAAEGGIGDPFVVWEIEVGPLGVLDVGLEPRPARKAVFAGDGELRVAQGDPLPLDGRLSGVGEPGMKLAEPLVRLGTTPDMGLPQIFGLVLEMGEVGPGRQGLGRHGSERGWASALSVKDAPLSAGKS